MFREIILTHESAGLLTHEVRFRYRTVILYARNTSSALVKIIVIVRIARYGGSFLENDREFNMDEIL